MTIMTPLAGQFGAAIGTGARWLKGDRSPTQAGASTVGARVRTRNPPAAGTAPTTPTRRGAAPRARSAAAWLRTTIGSVFQVPARAAPRPRSVAVTAAPAHVAPAATVRRTAA